LADLVFCFLSNGDVRNQGERNMVAGVFSAEITRTTGPLALQQFLRHPGNSSGKVGVSLSGGGSCALAAAMGQLRVLGKLTVNGQSVLAQVKALSVVSGGAWLGVPYVYLPPGAPSDIAYFGPWIENQAALTPEMLEVLPAGNAGVPISRTFAPAIGPLRPAGAYPVLSILLSLIAAVETIWARQSRIAPSQGFWTRPM
jgi:hypothetical protein